MTVLPVAHVSTNAPLAQSLRATSTASTPTSAPSAAPALTLAPLAQSASNFQTQKNPKRLVPHRTGRLFFPRAPSPLARPTIAAPPTKHRRPINNASTSLRQYVAPLVPPLSDKPNNASTAPRQCVASLVPPLSDKPTRPSHGHRPSQGAPSVVRGGGLAGGGERKQMFVG